MLTEREAVAALARLKLKTRVVGPHFDPDTSGSFLGFKLALPVMGSSVAGLGGWGTADDERDLCFASVQGCRQAGTIGWRGDTVSYTLEDNPGLEAIESELVAPDRLITHRMGLPDVRAALDLMAKGNALKILIEP